MKRRDFLTASTAVAAGATLRTMPSLAQSQPANSTNIELDSNPLFKAWRDPVTGVTSYILEKRVAPHQQGFYFTSPSLTPDARYLWFYCAFPPSGSANLGRSLGVADLQKGTMRHFPETEFSDGSPMVDPLNGEVYWCNNLDVWKRGPDEGQDAVWINSFPKALAKGRRPYRLATHLILRSDRKSFNIDAQIGNEWFIGELPLDGGPFELWQKLDRCYNHAQFSPTDPDVQFVAADWWYDAATGAAETFTDRMFLLKRGEKLRPLFPDAPSNRRTHEWWDEDGKRVWFVDYEGGVLWVDINSSEVRSVWKAPAEWNAPIIHADCNRAGDLLVGDVGTYSWATTSCKLSFFNVKTGKSVDIVSNLPLPTGGAGKYHIHPHPYFCGGDRFICYTTTVHDGRCDVALVPMASLVAATS